LAATTAGVAAAGVGAWGMGWLQRPVIDHQSLADDVNWYNDALRDERSNCPSNEVGCAGGLCLVC